MLPSYEAKISLNLDPWHLWTHVAYCGNIHWWVSKRFALMAWNSLAGTISSWVLMHFKSWITLWWCKMAIWERDWLSIHYLCIPYADDMPFTLAYCANSPYNLQDKARCCEIYLFIVRWLHRGWKWVHLKCICFLPCKEIICCSVYWSCEDQSPSYGVITCMWFYFHARTIEGQTKGLYFTLYCHWQEFRRLTFQNWNLTTIDNDKSPS